MMERIVLNMNRASTLMVVGMLTVGQAVADKPSWAGNGKDGKGENSEHREQSENGKGGHRDGDDRSLHGNTRPQVRTGEYFVDRAG